MMENEFGIIFNYRLKGLSPLERTRINKKFLGYIDRSQFEKYTYYREGVMSKIPHIYVSNSLFIILENDLNKVKSFFEQYNVELFLREVILTESDIEVLKK